MSDKNCLDVIDEKYKLLISEEQIDRRVKELASQISNEVGPETQGAALSTALNADWRSVKASSQLRPDALPVAFSST